MKGYDLMKQFEALPEERRKYAFQYFTGGLSMVADGFTEPHPDQAHARWAIQQLDEAMKQEPKENEQGELAKLQACDAKAKELCSTIEALPASIWQTELSSSASGVLQTIQRKLYPDLYK